jgi:hypothetical protein
VIDFAESPTPELESPLPAIQTGLRVAPRSDDRDAVFTVLSVDSKKVRLSTKWSADYTVTLKRFWECYEPLELRAALNSEHRPTLYPGLIARRQGRISENPIVAVEGNAVTVLGETPIVVDLFWTIFELMPEPESPKPPAEPVELSVLLEIGSQLALIDRLISELSTAHRSSEEKLDPHSSRAFQTLVARRSELHRELVALG